MGVDTLDIVLFIIFAVVAFMIDFFAHRKDEKISLKSATVWSIFWIAVSIIFGIILYFRHGSEFASLFFAGYVLEKSLSVDNLFVMMAIFTWFKIPEIYRHRVLYFGIIGAVIFRLIFVAIGTGLLAIGPWAQIVFAIVVALSAVMMLKGGDDEEEISDYSNHLAYKLVYKIFPVYPKLIGHSFFVRRNKIENRDLISAKSGLYVATPLFLCLCVIEVSDVVFAFDSVPAIIAVSLDPFIIYSAMIFAILGLRTLYFVLEALKDYLVHLEKAVIFLLFFIAFKLGLNATNHIFHHGYEISATTSLYVILIILSTGIIASFIFPQKDND